VSVIEHAPIFRLPGIPDHVTYTWVVMAILTVAAVFILRDIHRRASEMS